ncbi:hypothetical protein EI94DRAFT_1821442 [Lactarius quietus]|nr:hypothetical protein EI94DRAFT_1821442 [Lactarius quietus]
MKKLAARDFEDILQCCIPCFEGLLPAPHDNSVQKLLYLASYWHSLVKLRIHTEMTLKVLDHITVLFARALRHFKETTCPRFNTVETDREYQARRRAAEQRSSRGSRQPANVALPHSTGQSFVTTAGGKRPKTFNLLTSKLHALGDYVENIKMFGMTDSYSTQIRTFELLTLTTIPLFVVSIIVRDFTDRPTGNHPCNPDPPVGATGHWCRIAQNQSHKVYLPQFLNDSQNILDPAFKDFYNKLLTHLLARHLHQVTVSDEPEYTIDELANMKIQHKMMFSHATATLYYTAYNTAQDHDYINCHNLQCFIMLRACDDAGHPFCFDTRPERVEFFFGGPGTCRLDRIGWVPESDPSGAFGFLDPARVIRACHLIPAFSYGKTTSLLSASQARDFLTADWVNYYVSRFVDRDMMM